MQIVCVCLYGQNLKLYYKVCYILFPLFKYFKFLFSICCLCLVTEYCLDFFYKILLILDSYFFIQLIKLLLCIYIYHTSSKACKNCYDLIISLYDPVCYSNHSSHRQMISQTIKLSSGLSRRVEDLQENLTRSPRYITSLYI